jgi:hypothetical protein
VGETQQGSTIRTCRTRSRKPDDVCSSIRTIDVIQRYHVTCNVSEAFYVLFFSSDRNIESSKHRRVESAQARPISSKVGENHALASSRSQSQSSHQRCPPSLLYIPLPHHEPLTPTNPSPHGQEAQHGNIRLCHASERGRTTATRPAMQLERV